MKSLKESINDYTHKNPKENSAFEMLSLLKTDGCFLKDNYDGHFTGSAWIMSPDKEEILMTHHKKLGMWLQLGGHADGENDLLKVALREAKEESGIQYFNILSNEIFDLDIHDIPKHMNQPSHKHYDIRFLLEADPVSSKITISDESYDVAWIPIDEVIELNPENSIQRMVEKTFVIKNLDSYSFKNQL